MRRVAIHPPPSVPSRHFPVIFTAIGRIRGGCASAADSVEEGRFESGGPCRRAGASARGRGGVEAVPCAEASQPPTNRTPSRVFFVTTSVSLHSDRRQHRQIRISPFATQSWTADLAFLSTYHHGILDRRKHLALLKVLVDCDKDTTKSLGGLVDHALDYMHDKEIPARTLFAIKERLELLQQDALEAKVQAFPQIAKYEGMT